LITTLAPEEQDTRALTVFLPADVHEGLREVARQNERSLSAEVRHLLRRYVESPEDFGGQS
jgi:plasmid stability protein